jgi:hypothetical protein
MQLTGNTAIKRPDHHAQSAPARRRHPPQVLPALAVFELTATVEQLRLQEDLGQGQARSVHVSWATLPLKPREPSRSGPLGAPARLLAHPPARPPARPTDPDPDRPTPADHSPASTPPWLCPSHLLLTLPFYLPGPTLLRCYDATIYRTVMAATSSEARRPCRSCRSTAKPTFRRTRTTTMGGRASAATTANSTATAAAGTAQGGARTATWANRMSGSTPAARPSGGAAAGRSDRGTPTRGESALWHGAAAGTTRRATSRTTPRGPLSAPRTGVAAATSTWCMGGARRGTAAGSTRSGRPFHRRGPAAGGRCRPTHARTTAVAVAAAAATTAATAETPCVSRARARCRPRPRSTRRARRARRSAPSRPTSRATTSPT